MPLILGSGAKVSNFYAKTQRHMILKAKNEVVDFRSNVVLDPVHADLQSKAICEDTEVA